MLGMWDVQDVVCRGCLGCGMFGMCNFGNVGCLGYGLLRMWNIEVAVCLVCRMFGIWNVRDIDVWDLIYCGCGIFKV